MMNTNNLDAAGKEEILKNRKLGMTISEISRLTNIPITTICEVIQAQNEEDARNDRAN